MNNGSTQAESYRLTASEERRDPSIRECLRRALDEYFGHLDGHAPTHLHEIVMREVEPPLLEATLRYTGGNQTKAAKYLGMNRSTLRKKLRQYGISSANNAPLK